MLDFAGTIKQHQGKAEVGPGTDPKTFDEAVATATRLESLDKIKPGKVTFKYTGKGKGDKEAGQSGN